MMNSQIVTRTRLSSITEEEPQFQPQQKTSKALLKVYHDLYCLSYTKIAYGSSRDIFKKISGQVNEKLSLSNSRFQPFNDKSAEQNNNSYITNFQKLYGHKKYKNNKFISKKQFQAMAKERGSPSKSKQSILYEPSIQKSSLSAPKSKFSDSSTQNLSQIMTKLQQFDEERSAIKCQVFSQQTQALDQLYQKWAHIHCSTKQILQAYLSKISNGQTSELFDKLTNSQDLQGQIQGYPKILVYSKFDQYFQTLYMDERELILYNQSVSQKFRQQSYFKGSKDYVESPQKKNQNTHFKFPNFKNNKTKSLGNSRVAMKNNF